MGCIVGFSGGLIVMYIILAMLIAVSDSLDRSLSSAEDSTPPEIRQWYAKRRQALGISEQGHSDTFKAHAVILMYNSECIPSSDPGFPDVETDYLYGCCLPVEEETEEEFILKYKDKTIRVFKDECLQAPYPGYNIGQEVETLPPRTFRKGKIGLIEWHFKNRTALFFLEVNGKVSRKRYFGYELKPV